MSEKKPEGTIKVSALYEALGAVHLSTYEAQIVGEMLVAFFESERALDLCLLAYFSPSVFERGEELRDELVLYVPLSRKLDFVESRKLLSSSTVKLFRSLADQRNYLAHPRPDKDRPGRKISADQKKKFVTDCHRIGKDILRETQVIWRGVVDHLKREFKSIVRAAMGSDDKGSTGA